VKAEARYMPAGAHHSLEGAADESGRVWWRVRYTSVRRQAVCRTLVLALDPREAEFRFKRDTGSHCEFLAVEGLSHQPTDKE